MTGSDPNKVVLTDVAAAALRDDFLGWQCRLRQISARQGGGRPTSGMRPRLLTPADETLASGVTVLIVEHDPVNTTRMFEFQCKRTHDPIERYDKILELLSASYFQHPRNFSDMLTALFGAASDLPPALLHLGRCVLEFEQFAQGYRIPCEVMELDPAHDFYQATYWHNHMFNATMPSNARILAFKPDWAHASEWRTEG